ncbi:fatty acid cis/trans isomerase [Colwellia sp. MB3u-28]|nr:fatty acid cis/trans isomerase [Colwellia sp. MB02u-7]MBA6236857.1 fatty acid cis/trans isomerase [Colwellia sp. MB02u-11]MBA6256200.1 fatty acid cis/trans isomerase [Colwellia sp. MB3u-28]MBA6260084.1 fatty acid cis/trans isomerase [Colwellia sp. MB3u-41]MBA6300003.1 fatty acid cis/trans isomerase [Colwellia sp. MB3u-22]MBA6301850.1 fatty acid cis/trans isomerase [Colwellia sp. MB02u-14]MBA6312688.1 fatty acid cis/trans isomerase [Colwellia sp. MB3u-64]
MYLANLYFDATQQSFLNLVRSKTPSTQALQIITTRHPF